jgi:hypothetical protein
MMEKSGLRVDQRAAAAERVVGGSIKSDGEGQRAMAVAMLFPEPDKRGRGNKGKSTESVGFSQQRLREARQVLRFSPELACAVRELYVYAEFASILVHTL